MGDRARGVGGMLLLLLLLSVGMRCDSSVDFAGLTTSASSASLATSSLSTVDSKDDLWLIEWPRLFDCDRRRNALTSVVE
jgi:hypothetical protein